MRRIARLLLPLGFLVYFNFLYTFESRPSTFAVKASARISPEVLLLALALAIASVRGITLPRWAKAGLAALLSLGALIRYFELTTLSVLGREFNLHGDFPHLHRVFDMFWESVSLGTGMLVLGSLLTVTVLSLALSWIGLVALERFLRAPIARRAVLGGGLLLLVAGLAGGGRLFSRTSTAILAKQIGNLRAGEAERAALADIEWPEIETESNLKGLDGADVYLIFLESYGVTLIEDAQHFDRIGPRYRKLEERLAEAGYRFSSAQIHSPTFGGGSWRAHATLLSGIRVSSEHVYNALITSERPTLVHLLEEVGYRTVAAEPGIKFLWPDGAFYGFDRIYDFEGLGYQGPPMGWWKIPDQYTLYRIYQTEIREKEKRRPLFAKFSLIMSHIPYFPIPPYVEDWSRFDDRTAYRESLHSVAHDAYRDLDELSSWYVKAFEYELDILEGFLLDYVPANALVIVVGDHQPPKLVTHDNGSWAVPMHLISRREELIRPFDTLGFRDGLVPLHQGPLKMEEFLDHFLAAYHRETMATDQ